MPYTAWPWRSEQHLQGNKTHYKNNYRSFNPPYKQTTNHFCEFKLFFSIMTRQPVARRAQWTKASTLPWLVPKSINFCEVRLGKNNGPSDRPLHEQHNETPAVLDDIRWCDSWQTRLRAGHLHASTAQHATKHASLAYWKPRAHLTLHSQSLLSRTTRYSWGYPINKTPSDWVKSTRQI